MIKNFFLDELVKQDANKFKIIDNIIDLIDDPSDEIAFAIEFSNLSKLYKNNLIEKNKIKQLPLDLQLNTLTSLEVARIYLLVKIAYKFEQEYVYMIENLFNTADNNELIALYKSLSFLPEPQKFLLRAHEAARSNNTLLFNSIALNNNYPRNFFDENSWNQLILKAFFIESDIEQILGVQERINPKLIKMLNDFASEAFKAGRTVNPEIFKLVKML